MPWPAAAAPGSGPEVTLPAGGGLEAGGGKRQAGSGSAWRLAGWRRSGVWALTAVVLGVHFFLANRVLEQRMGWGSGDKPPPRIDVAFVRELAPAAPPAAAAPAPPPAPPARLPALAARAKGAASAPAEAIESAAPAAPAAADTLPALAVADPAPPLPAPQPAETRAVGVAPVASGPAATAATTTATTTTTTTATTTATPPTAAVPPMSAASAARFDWPPSTRMNYRLSGNYRGPIDGKAQVEWLREGSRYQVRMSTSIGPVLSRNISSEGELTDTGLAPRRFDGEQKVLFRAPKRWSLRFGPDRIVLADGRETPTLPGAQDEASQFVQLTWLFTTRPEQLKVGQSIEIPLAVTRSLDRWIYDVVAEEVLEFPFGAVATFHVKPRRQATGGDLSAEIWFAPMLQYLPVRILIRQPPESWVDLTLERPPLQAADAPR